MSQTKSLIINNLPKGQKKSSEVLFFYNYKTKRYVIKPLTKGNYRVKRDSVLVGKVAYPRRVKDCILKIIDSKNIDVIKEMIIDL